MHVELARAKVNLCLHVTGRRTDGMHLLDSLVVFPEIGDELRAKKSDELTLAIDGPFGQNLSSDDDNLVLKAARLLGNVTAELQLTKNLPVASGIGGGSADAAACIRSLSKLWDVRIPTIEVLAKLGADVPVCINQTPTRMSGIGEVLELLPKLPTFWIVLANAGEAVATGAIFDAMSKRDNAEIIAMPEKFPTLEAFFNFLRCQRNDMQDAAIKICPVISEVLAAIGATEECELARMSGSGGTCFGLYASATAAQNAAATIQSNYPNWWVVSAEV